MLLDVRGAAVGDEEQDALDGLPGSAVGAGAASLLSNHRNFTLLFGARLTDTAGNAIAPVALAFAVLDVTGSAADIGLVVGARSLALAVLLLLGGVLADRWPRSLVLVWSNVLSAATQAAIATLVLTDQADIGLLVGLSLVNGGAAAVSFPAAGALIADTVPRQLLQRANATVGSGTTMVNLGGLVMGAALVAAVGPGWGLAVDAASFLLTAALFSRLRVSESKRSRGPMLGELREGWTTFVRLPWIWTTVLAFMVVNAVYSGAIAVLGPAIADDGIGRARWGWVLAAQAAGVLATTLALTRTNRPLRLRPGVAIAALSAPWILMLGLSPTLVPLMVTAFAAGIGFGYFDVTWDTNLQSNIAGEQLARVYSFDMTGSILALPIGQVAMGPVAVAVGRTPTLVGAALHHRRSIPTTWVEKARERSSTDRATRPPDDVSRTGRGRRR